MKKESCPICIEDFEIKNVQQQLFNASDSDVYVLQCFHKFHFSCLKDLIADKKFIKCPICKQIYGCMIGDQPEGQMFYKMCPITRLGGYQKNGAIIINYTLKSGLKNGIKYSGTSRTAYLPDNDQGKQVLQLLKLAFQRKLIFTVGKSITTGLDNSTIWNGIHHKTSPNGGVSSYGYPDQTYLTRVKQQLAAKGITSKSLKNKNI